MSKVDASFKQLFHRNNRHVCSSCFLSGFWSSACLIFQQDWRCQHRC
ncbi:hypothetical protein GBL_0403 [Geobacillus kaustophilus GBlys]|uniref:Uncharacterized protein n=1 Tax=Geobacillus kaustophilus GBlys TaxID=1337888 RepID=S4N9U9_GEOKU|nr:hypothetical protein GBL_0403 [Geobacillus kaustophilus GBlys]